MSLTRREFIRWIATLGSIASLQPVFSDSKIPQRQQQSRQHRKPIPSSGELIPVIGLGSWLTFGIDPEDNEEMKQREAVMREFLNRGGGMLDSSPMYGNAEQVIGMLLKKIGKRDGLFSATKVWTYGERQGFLQMEHSRLL
ncbi:aldo/keto reductase, partial [Kaarinaea lacus]